MRRLRIAVRIGALVTVLVVASVAAAGPQNYPARQPPPSLIERIMVWILDGLSVPPG